MRIIFFIILSSSFLLQGCSPFDNSSLIEITHNFIDDIFEAKITQDLNSGGSQNLISNPASGLLQDNHSVTLSAGNTFQQSSYVTPQGHTVEVMISGVRK